MVQRSLYVKLSSGTWVGYSTAPWMTVGSLNSHVPHDRSPAPPPPPSILYPSWPEALRREA